ncbi:hypothetical protein [Paracoccus benzoatiresistens]|uniref:hypothetical protein n=1 Tax=Paracoccus benzoatiresistens TaxID=2997341 RepID=UPI0022A6F6C1|nr:hypothetical protein [Paracoccus sp. EF6]
MVAIKNMARATTGSLWICHFRALTRVQPVPPIGMRGLGARLARTCPAVAIARSASGSMLIGRDDGATSGYTGVRDGKRAISLRLLSPEVSQDDPYGLGSSKSVI